MKKHEDLIHRLEQHRTKAPESLTQRVMDTLPEWKPAKRKSWLVRQRNWLLPALAGAAATLAIMLGINHVAPNKESASTPQVSTAETEIESMVTLRFELFAPEADEVELLGTFNDWKAGDIVLTQSGTGQWEATVELPEGRHEYVFLVDGERWLADPQATIRRPDGFGKMNTVIQVYDNDNV